MAEAELVASVVLQELLEELVPSCCESDDELECIAIYTVFTNGGCAEKSLVHVPNTKTRHFRINKK